MSDYAQVHALRFQQSLAWLAPYLTRKAFVLELGGYSPFSQLVMPQVDMLCVTAHDLRYPDPVSQSAAWDVVLCMEVIEHVADTDGKHTEWQGDGVRTMLREAFRVLKPGGVLFLTTPNAASITAIHHALRQAPPMIWRPHTREYVPYELDDLVRAAGFVIVRRETLDVWRNAISRRDHERIAQFVADSGYPGELRGEDIFLLGRKL